MQNVVEKKLKTLGTCEGSSWERNKEVSLGKE
jgi:hypothetical protein